MTIIASRIDGRLIHGQVANLWTSKLSISRLMVVDDVMSQDTIGKQGLKLATPAGVKLSVLPVEKAAANIIAGNYDTQRVMIVARHPEEFLSLIESGVPITEINVGNMSQSEQTRSITRSVNVLDTHIDTFIKLDEKGIKLINQMSPQENAVDFIKILKKVLSDS